MKNVKNVKKNIVNNMKNQEKTMNLNKIVNEILKAEKECIGYEIRCQCCEGKLRKNNVCENCEEGVAPAESVNYPIFEYKEIHLEDLLLALNKTGVLYKLQFCDENIESVVISICCSGEITLKLTKPLSKQKPEVTKKLIEILL